MATIHFDPLAPDQREDRYPVYALARREQPVFYALRRPDRRLL